MALFNHPTVAGLAVEITGDTAAVASAVIQPCDRSERLPLSFAQQRLWFLDQLEPENPAYHLYLPLEMRGTLDKTALQSALAVLQSYNGKPISEVPDFVIDLRDRLDAACDNAERHQGSLRICGYCLEPLKDRARRGMEFCSASCRGKHYRRGQVIIVGCAS